MLPSFEVMGDTSAIKYAMIFLPALQEIQYGLQQLLSRNTWSELKTGTVSRLNEW